MPEVVEQFEFGRSPNGTSKWDKYLDGQIYRFTREDGLSFGYIRTAMSNRAKRHGLKVHAAHDGATLVVQAYTPNGDAA